MRTWRLVLACLLIGSPALAQSRVDVDPTSILAWDAPPEVTSLPQANAYRFRVYVDGGAPVLVAHTCVAIPGAALTDPQFTCQAAKAFIGVVPGDHDIRMSSEFLSREGPWSAPLSIRFFAVPAPAPPIRIRIAVSATTANGQPVPIVVEVR